MYSSGGPTNPGPYPPPQPPANSSRSTAAKVFGWILLVIGVLVALANLITGNGFGGRIGGFLLGAAIAALGAMLIWKFTSWRIAGPGAALALVLGMLISPSAPKESTPVSGLLGPTSVATVTSSATQTITVTASTTTTTAPSSTTTTAATTTTTTAPPPNPVVTETNTRTPVPTAAAPRTPTTTVAPEAPSGGSTSYPNCTAAKAAGAAPIYKGQPGYRSGLDRDGDGIACDK